MSMIIYPADETALSLGQEEFEKLISSNFVDVVFLGDSARLGEVPWQIFRLAEIITTDGPEWVQQDLARAVAKHLGKPVVLMDPEGDSVTFNP